MIRPRIYLLAVILFATTYAYGQLDKFMIQTYLFDSKPANVGYEDFFRELKNTYSFNSVCIISRNEDVPQKCKAAKKAGLMTCLETWNLNSRRVAEMYKYGALQDLNNFSGSEYDVRGYHITDEPDARTTSYPNGWDNNDKTIVDYIDNIPQYTNFIKEYNPSLLRYANLLPIYVFNDKEYREEYLQKYIDQSQPNLLSFDHYPIYDYYFLPQYDNVRDFYLSLYAFALKSAENSIPFIYVMTPYKSHLDIFSEDSVLNAKSINELNYVIYAALAYGAKGISYWSGFQWAVGPWPDEKKKELKYKEEDLGKLIALHKKLIKNSDELLSLNFISAYHQSSKGTIGSKPEKLHPFNSLTGYFSKDLYAKQIFRNWATPCYEYSTNRIPEELVISFLINKSGKVYFWLFNKSLKRQLKLKMNLTNNCRDVLNGTYLESLGIVTLEPGEGKLFTETRSFPSPISNNINSTTYENQLYSLEIYDTLTIGKESTDSNVIFESGATKSFCANDIVIKSLHAKPGSNVWFKIYKDSNTKPTTILAGTNEDSSTGIEENAYPDQDAYVYPNPIIGHSINLYVNLDSEEEINVNVYDFTGKIIKRIKTSTSETIIPTENLQSGVYILNFIRNNKVYNIKIMK